MNHNLKWACLTWVLQKLASQLLTKGTNAKFDMDDTDIHTVKYNT